ncbi:hypothetical protein KIW84_024777 [Lathyrus oleraceus]|uniref:non-specific serine/threonine protein kinase n=1 Tax=Pisum sativum TaxID=3888 RepID=A0A9D5BCL3_PEA|nr:hypothetical protein KIW84_024777 [Pisum sativum]
MWSCIPYHPELALSVREGFLFKDPFGFGAIRSEAKCCGIGSVYCVALDDDLGYVAVKTIRGNSRKLDQKLVDSFLAEVEILSKIRHNNIVKLMCCISSDDLLLLAYEYHEHQSLDRILIKPEELATMSVVAGTFGYIAPKYAQSIRVNEKIDVYSFGAVLLELKTEKEVNPGDEYSSLAE